MAFSNGQVTGETPGGCSSSSCSCGMPRIAAVGAVAQLLRSSRPARLPTTATATGVASRRLQGPTRRQRGSKEHVAAAIAAGACAVSFLELSLPRLATGRTAASFARRHLLRSIGIARRVSFGALCQPTSSGPCLPNATTLERGARPSHASGSVTLQDPTRLFTLQNNAMLHHELCMRVW